jgi:UDP-N-acetyl-D-glucosamine dehydrogenase
MTDIVSALLASFHGRSATIGVMGLGYVGIPLALAAARKGFTVLGFDIDAERVRRLAQGESVLKHIETTEIAAAVASGRFSVTTDMGRLNEPDAILITVPTPLDRTREPDMRPVITAAQAISQSLRKGQLIVLESTTYPGTTEELVRPILEQGGLRSGKDFFLAYSPEREDPGNASFETATIPKVVGGDGAEALALADALYGAIVVRTVPVSSARTAEAAKLTENIFRAINIGLVNELKGIYAAMGIDIWEVMDAAATKPFGFMPFYPGPGVGGRCIPIDPFYLTWKAREFDMPTRFIELAGEINARMPYRIVEGLAEAVDRRLGKGLSTAKILIMGISYKKNIDDMRESPAIRLFELIEARGASVDFHDPFFAAIPPTREHPGLTGRRSIALSAEALGRYDAALIATDHDGIDYRLVADHVRIVLDTRNACARRGIAAESIIKA